MSEEITLLRLYDSNKSIGFNGYIFDPEFEDPDFLLQVVGVLRMAERKILDRVEEIKVNK